MNSDFERDWSYNEGVAWMSRNTADVRTFYPSELTYLRDIRARYACAYCGTSGSTCGSCREVNERIEELERVSSS